MILGLEDLLRDDLTGEREMYPNPQKPWCLIRNDGNGRCETIKRFESKIEADAALTLYSMEVICAADCTCKKDNPAAHSSQEWIIRARKSTNNKCTHCERGFASREQAEKVAKSFTLSIVHENQHPKYLKASIQ